MNSSLWTLISLFILCDGLRFSSTPPPPPFNVGGGITFLRYGQIYDPEPLGSLDVVLAGSSILSLLKSDTTDKLIDALTAAGVVVKTVDISNSYVVPGLVDVHVHPIGGGGEAGPYSRTPEGPISSLVKAGTTTVIGLLGTDGVTRDHRSLLQKLNELDYDGITAYMWTGAYRVPAPTLTGDVQADLTLINRVIGVGELCLSDHRSSWPSYQEVVRIVSDARVAGLLSGKAGVVHFHLGTAPSMIDILWQIVNSTTIPITNMYPTHMSSRGDNLLAQAKKWISAGGFCDFTADSGSDTDTIDAILEFDREGLPLNRLSVSSDAFGSLPSFDSSGALIGYSAAPPNTPLLTIQNLVQKYSWPLEKALQFSTLNPATFLGLNNKGRIQPGLDGDLLVLDRGTLQPVYVFAKGQPVLTPTWTKTGLFE